MLSYTFRMPSTLLARLKDRAAGIPISLIIRRLIERYIKGEIDLDL